MDDKKKVSRAKKSTPEQKAANAARNKENKVAQYSNPRTSGPTKPEKRLTTRLLDFSKTQASLKDSSSYKRPGSLKK